MFAQRPGAVQSAHTGLFDIPDSASGDVAVGGYVPKYENAASVIASQIKEYYTSGRIDGTHFHLTDGQYLFDSRKLKELKIAEYAFPRGVWSRIP